MPAISEYRPVQSQTPTMEWGVVDAFRAAFTNDLRASPTTPPTWADRTRGLLTEKYSSLPLIAQRSLHIFTNLGSAFPDCPSLEAMTRQIVRLGDFDKEKVLSLFQRFQERAKVVGNTPLLQTAVIMPVVIPMLDNLPADEKEFWTKAATILPAIIIASIGARKIDLRNLSDDELAKITAQKELNLGDKDEYILFQRAASLRPTRKLADEGSNKSQERLKRDDFWVVKKPE